MLTVWHHFIAKLLRLSWRKCKTLATELMQKWERRKYTCCNLHKHLFLSKSFPIYRNVNYRTLPSKTLYVNSFMGQTFILWWFYESGDLNDIFLAGLITVQKKNALRSRQRKIYTYIFTYIWIFYCQAQVQVQIS